MEFTLNQAANFVGKEITVSGWVYNKRSSGAIVFLQLRDGTGFIQAIVLKEKVSESVFIKAKDLMLESSVEITGKLKEEPRSPSGYEITVSDIKVIQAVTEEYPIGKKDHGPDFLLQHRHLWLRSKRQWAILRVRNVIINSIYKYLADEGYVKIDAPILTPAACEGTTTLFSVPYLPAWKGEASDWLDQVKEAKAKPEEYPFVYLSQSGQLYLEAAIMAHRKVFDFGPTFRAEKSKTRRHLMEFWMMDAEAAFVDHAANIKIQEKLISFVVGKVLEYCVLELKLLERDTTSLVNSAKGDYPVVTHVQAIEMLRKENVQIGERDDFGAEHETVLASKFDRPFFIEKYPKEVKAFYMKEDLEDHTRVLNSDMLAPEGHGEIIGGSQREDDYATLIAKIKAHHLPLEEFQWYLDLRRFGSVPHSGFGLGIERLVAWVCKLDHVREAIPFPRMMERFKP